jgi:hypothetical protein
MPGEQDFDSVLELARRWRCSRATVRDRLRSASAAEFCVMVSGTVVRAVRAQG